MNKLERDALAYLIAHPDGNPDHTQLDTGNCSTCQNGFFSAVAVEDTFLAGRAVVDLPEPDGVTARELLQTHDAADLRGAEHELLQYLANLREAARTLSAESRKDGEQR